MLAPIPMPGDVLEGGRFEVVRTYEGGMGVVLLVVDHANADSPLALKTLRPEALSDASLREVFLREATLWSRISRHPHIVQAYGVFRLGPERAPHLALEYVAPEEGSKDPSLRARIAPGQPLASWYALALGLQIVRGMIHATLEIPGLVHRDLKLDNVLVGRDGLAKITDFGLALAPPSTGLDALFRAAEPGEVAGSPSSVAPEHWNGQALDVRTDLYAFGCMLYEMLIGVPPVAGHDVESYRAAHVAGAAEQAPIPASFPEELVSLLRSCLALDRESRPSSFAAVEPVLEAMYELATGQPAPRSPSPAELEQLDFLSLGASLLSLGLASADIGRHDAALAFYERVHGVARTLGDRALDAAALSNASLSLGALGDLGGALQAAERAIATYRAVGDRRGEAKATANEGGFLAELGRTQEALARLTEALPVLAAEGDYAAVANVRTRMAPLFAVTGRLDEAARSLEESVQLFERLGDRRSRAVALGTLGQMRRRQRRVDEAIDCAEESIALFRAIGDRGGEARELAILGHHQAAAGRKAKAIDCWNQSLEMAEQVGDRLLEGTTSYTLATCFLEMANATHDPRPLRNAFALATSADRLYRECERLDYAADAARLAEHVAAQLRAAGLA